MILNKYFTLLTFSLIILVGCRPFVDKDAPIIQEANFPNAFSTIQTGGDFVIDVKASDNQFVKMAYFTFKPLVITEGAEKIPLTDHYEVSTSEETPQHTFSQYIRIQNAQSAPYVIYAQVVDNSGNVGIAESDLFFVSSFGDPVMDSLYEPAQNDSFPIYYANDSLHFDGFMYDNDTIKQVNLYEFTKAPSTFNLLQSVNVDTTYVYGSVFKYGWTLLKPRTFIVSATDKYGNANFKAFSIR